jgi:hypothetical protein
MATAICFSCRYRAAVGYSAYCGSCQPKSVAQIHGSQCGCGACGNVFATLTDFEDHQIRGGPLLALCVEPVAMGLEIRDRVWGTPEGNANRDRKARALTASRALRRS